MERSRHHIAPSAVPNIHDMLICTIIWKLIQYNCFRMSCNDLSEWSNENQTQYEWYKVNIIQIVVGNWNVNFHLRWGPHCSLIFVHILYNQYLYILIKILKQNTNLIIYCSSLRAWALSISYGRYNRIESCISVNCFKFFISIFGKPISAHISNECQERQQHHRFMP